MSLSVYLILSYQVLKDIMQLLTCMYYFSVSTYDISYVNYVM